MITTVTSVNGAVVEAGSFMSYVVGGLLMVKIILPFVLMFFLWKVLFGKSKEEKDQAKADVKSGKAKSAMMNKYKTKRRY